VIDKTEPAVTLDELQLATRNHGMPLEALCHPVTPVGLHYLLTHFDIPVIDAATWRLRVDGLVDRPLELSLSELIDMPSVTAACTMECAGNGRALMDGRPSSQPWLLEAVGTGEWMGVPLAHVLAAAGLQAGASEVVFTGADRGIDGGVEQAYQRSLSVEVATLPDVLLAHSLNGAPVPPQHGHPLRLVVPGWYGMTNVKWLTTITATDEPFDGYQQANSYRWRQDEDEVGEPLTRMRPRSLMRPPGIPDYLTRERHLTPGVHRIEGRAWSGHGPIRQVALSVDGGQRWHAAEVDPPSLGPAAWQAWHYDWDAAAGDYELCCRATDEAGNQQPLAPEWNVGGYTNNAVQRVVVHVVCATGERTFTH
jgi:sulfane dehydrogenase subunit SoxC